MAITRIKLSQFTTFEQLETSFSPGVNVFLGANGTGKTHLMKAIYAACDVSKTKRDFAEKLVGVFMPSGGALGRLVRRQKVSTRGVVEVYRTPAQQDRKRELKLRARFSNHSKAPDSATIGGAREWTEHPIESVYVPVKEMLSHAPGFRSLYSQREIHFEEVYADILDRAYRPALRGPATADRRKLLNILQKIMAGKIVLKDEEFFLRNQQGNLEFALLAEGMRKLGLLWLLIQNGTLLEGSVLFWDEPGSNLNPKLFGSLMEILLMLQRLGVQVFLATHDYVILKELDLRRDKDDEVLFHSMYREQSCGPVACHTVGCYADIHPNAIADAFGDLYDREVKRALERPSS